MKVRRRRYVTVLADPPWPERGGGKIKRGADKHYPLMSVMDIAALRPPRLWTTANSHCYLWVTNTHLPAGLLVLNAWGYRYVTCLTWHKDRQGLGQYYRGMSEHVLFGVRGRIPYRMLPDGQHRAQGVTCFSAPRTIHSQKPEILRAMIERVSPGPYLELFARRPVKGWTVWGNEV